MSAVTSVPQESYTEIQDVNNTNNNLNTVSLEAFPAPENKNATAAPKNDRETNSADQGVTLSYKNIF